MSAHVLESFLPWTVDRLKSGKWTRSVWDVIFPAEVMDLCPAPTYSIPFGWEPWIVKWPAVAVFCVIGFLGGLYLGLHLLLSQRRSQQVPGYFMWGFSCFWYGFMCLGALFTHCIQTNHISIFYLMDVIATGCCGISAAGGFLSVWKVIDDRRVTWQLVAISTFTVVNILAVNSTAFIRDQIYGIPCALTVILLVHHRRTYGRNALLLDDVTPDNVNAKTAEKWLAFGVAGSVLALGSVLADKWLCLAFGSHGSFLLWVFLGCDMALLSSYKFITALGGVSTETSYRKTKTI
ncbi:hypothetical protein MPTK1_2g00090 [Marchantia polymorpha subsp. ruderalis]|uniref:Uncharacterized protein n=2 Tax=Marchantia polymorpha TaxID=3197 RepID=A0A176W3Y1_MARPO|nr:hypothetical protein AXG93_4762s1060 [Marchantia polymorpha subsp. ruderalis]PTQ42856.1 hypothetical protein MARPO_0028s0142 [Marchantia polymorpha]BBN00541.1 hypothetical protein Mp_2g00090 [Marchantia polymorpha subsp. ruderalis]|eukprot:PTQ42856.1 hypothetical protein MARPO_0028s0142 [Marchantia polymorpha]